MKNLNPDNHRIFSVSEANATLPLVKSIVKDIVDLSAKVIRTRQRLAFLNAARDDHEPGFEHYKEETLAIAETVSDDERRLADCVAELYELGIEIHELTQGLIDFPAERNGEKVFLSWRYGEPQIDHWRIPSTALAKHEPLESDSDSELPQVPDRIPLDFFFADDASDPDCNLN